MQAALENDYNLQIIALSKDTVAEAATHKKRDELTLTLLADPTLAVIRQYGLEHHKALNFKTNQFTIASIPLTLVPSFKTMAIPTSLLIDEQGTILWIDQADDYRIRSDEERVQEAIESAFPKVSSFTEKSGKVTPGIDSA